MKYKLGTTGSENILEAENHMSHISSLILIIIVIITFTFYEASYGQARQRMESLKGTTRASTLTSYKRGEAGAQI